MDIDDLINKYRRRAEIAEEQVRQLRALLHSSMAFPAEWKLTPAEERILSLLATRGEASNEALETVVPRHDGTSIRTVQVQICRLRKKIARHGIEIGTSWGRGYFLDEGSRKIVKAALRAAGGVENTEMN